MKLTVIITVKQGGQFLYRTLMNIKNLSDGGIEDLEVICLLKSKDIESNRFAKKATSFIKNLTTIKYDNFDIGQVKNSAAKKAKGKYLLFVDSGDFFSHNFLREFDRQIEDCEKSAEKTIFVPEMTITFGKQLFIQKNLSTEDSSFSKSIFLFENPWGNDFLISKKDFCEVLFPKVNFRNKLNPHILSFYCDCISLGYKVEIIPSTVSFIRLLDYEDNEQNFLLPNKAIFDKKIENFETKDNRSPNEKEEKLRESHFLLSKNAEEFLQKVFKDGDDRNILKRFFSAAFPQFYLKLYVLKKKFKKEKDIDEVKYPIWLVDEWKKINIFEPELFPPTYNIQEKQITINSKLDFYLEQVLSNFPKGIDYLFFCPWLKIGGADKVALNLMNALKELSPNKSIGVITTENVDSELLDNLPTGIHYFDFGNSFLDLTPFEREALF